VPASRKGFIVRILRSGSNAPAGVGFVVDNHHIVTCAHVVNTAMGRDQRAQQRPDQGVRIGVDFPLLSKAAGAPGRSCRVEAWAPPPVIGTSGGDVAGLLIIGEGLPAGAHVGRLAEEASLRDPPVDIFGYPEDPPRLERGAWVPVHLRDTVGDGLIQLDSDSESAIRAQPGYSGSPIVAKGDAGDEILGMLSVASRNEGTRDAYAIPAAQLADAWPDVLGGAIVPPCPYPGLEAFTAEDAETGVFVGREVETRQLREMLRKQELVIVVGPSGVGKSSLVNAGLMPVLQEERWITQTFRGGGAPLDALAQALFCIEQSDKTATLDDLAKWVDRLRTSGLQTCAAQLSLLTGKPILLVIDQLEQILDPGICPSMVSKEFIDLLLHTQPTDQLRLVCTLRADFLSQLLQHPEAGAYLRPRLFTLSPMGTEGMERVIREPAETRTVQYESGLCRLIARDAGDGGGLPLLGFTLKELWTKQRHRHITLAEYHEIGGVMGALRTYAESVYQELLEGFNDRQIRRVMLALVRSQGGSLEATRRVVSRELLGTDWAVAKALAEHRLVILGHDSVKGEDSVQVAHEALIREWPRFASWVDDDADFQHWLTAVENRAAEGDLLPDKRLAEADRWLTERADDIPQEIKQLIDDSKSEWSRRISELEQARNRAEAMARQAEARRLAAAAELGLASREISLQVPIALAVESLHKDFVFETDLATRHAIRKAARQISRIDQGSPVTAVAFSPEGYRIAGASDDGAWLSDSLTGAEIRRLKSGALVAAVTFSPDGTRVLTGSTDNKAQVFEATTGAELMCFQHGGPVTAVAFSPDGSRIATGSYDRFARVFDALTGVELARLEHGASVTAAAFSPDGSRVVTGSRDNSVRVFNATTGAELARLEHTRPVTAVAFSPDGSRVTTGSVDGHARVFATNTGVELSRMDQGGAVLAVALSPGGSRVATGGSNSLARVFDSATGAEVCRLECGGDVTAVAFSPDGAKVATGSRDSSARVFDAATGSELSRIDHGGAVVAVAFSSDGSRVVSGSRDGSARVFNTAAGAELSKLEQRGAVVAVTFRPDGTGVASGSWDGSACLIDAATGCEVWRSQHTGAVYAVAFDPRGTLIATASKDGTARVLDAETGVEQCHLENNDAVYAVAFDPGGSLIATGGKDGTVRVFSAVTGFEIWRVTLDGEVTTLAFSPDGSRVATGSDDGSARIIDAETGAELRRLDHDGAVVTVAFSPDGTRLATGSDDRSARIIDAETGAELCRLDHDGAVVTVAFSPDGTRVATGSWDATVRVLNIETGTELCRLDHDDDVVAVAFSPDGSRVATGSEDRSARIIDAETGTELCRLDHDGAVVAVAFSPDGTRLASGSDDRTTRVWAIELRGLIEQATARLTRNLSPQEWRRFFRDEPYRKTRTDLP
jgi:WD40 repeat protein/energy-coupling factor transporter ATP-binding protein EcfA2